MSRQRKQPISIRKWLPSLNGRFEDDETDYTKFLEPMRQLNISSTFEIYTMQVEGLLKIEGMQVGTAMRIWGWAKEDSAA
jgi:hypothetical protein